MIKKNIKIFEVRMVQVPKRLIYSLSATLSLSLAIFFKKKALLASIQPITLLIQFMVISALILTLNLFLFQKIEIKKIKKTHPLQWYLVLCAGSLLLIAYFFTTFGLEYTTSINYSFITRSNLIFTTILAFFFLKEEITGEKLLLIIGFFAGIYLVTTKGQKIIPQIGDLLILTGAFFFASFSVIQKRISTYLPAEVISWGVTSTGALLAILAALFFKIPLFTDHGLLFVFLAGLTEALVILFMNKTINITHVTYYAMMTMIVPIINGFLGVILLNELLNLTQILGGGILIICGILVQKLKA